MNFMPASVCCKGRFVSESRMFGLFHIIHVIPVAGVGTPVKPVYFREF